MGRVMHGMWSHYLVALGLPNQSRLSVRRDRTFASASIGWESRSSAPGRIVREYLGRVERTHPSFGGVSAGGRRGYLSGGRCRLSRRAEGTWI